MTHLMGIGLHTPENDTPVRGTFTLRSVNFNTRSVNFPTEGKFTKSAN